MTQLLPNQVCRGSCGSYPGPKGMLRLPFEVETDGFTTVCRNNHSTVSVFNVLIILLGQQNGPFYCLIVGVCRSSVLC